MDIESTTGSTCVPICVGLAFEKYEGVSIPLWSKLPWVDTKLFKKTGYVDVKNTYSTGVREADLPSIWTMLARLFADSGRRVIGHNFKYDETRLETLGFYFRNFYMDTGLAGFVLQPEFERNLGFWNSVYTDLPYFKDEGDAYNPNRKGFDDYLLYNAKDATATLQIAHEMLVRLRKSGLYQIYRQLQHELHYLYREIEDEGFSVDEERHSELLVHYLHREFEEQSKLNSIASVFTRKPTHINVNSPMKLARFMYETLGIPKVSTDEATNEDEVAKILLKHPELHPAKRAFVQGVLTTRKIKRITGPSLLGASRDYDGRMRGSTFIIGTTTGRTSNQQLKPPNRPVVIGWGFQTLPKHNAIGKEIREILIPAKRKRLPSS